MRENTRPLTVFCICSLVSSLALADPAVKFAVREALERASRASGREIAAKSAREAAERALERSSAKFGNRVLSAEADGGLELIDAAHEARRRCYEACARRLAHRPTRLRS